MADDPQRRVAPYSLINSPIPSSGLHDLSDSLARSRKHLIAESSDLLEPPSKRGVISDSHGQLVLGDIPSSPPISGANGSDTEEDECATPNQTFVSGFAKHASRSESTSTIVAPRLGSVAQRLTSASFAERSASRSASFGIKQLSPLAVIRKTVDTGREVLDLTERDIEQLPSEIGDLQHWVSLERATLKVCLGNNNLRYLHLGLFDVNISELLLRHNCLQEIPQQIANLKGLQELSVGSNNLSYLPAELLSLPHLTVVSAVPNPWLELPDGVENTTDEMPSLVFRQVHAETEPPTLVELAQRVLADHDLLVRDRKSWALSEHQQRLVDTAQISHERGHVCFHCRKPFIRAIGHVTEWWNVCHNKALPFRKFYCTQRCLRNDVYDL